VSERSGGGGGLRKTNMRATTKLTSFHSIYFALSALGAAFGTPSSYTLPNVGSLQLKNGNSDTNIAANAANTAGNDYIFITGTNFGPTTESNSPDAPVVLYGSSAMYTNGNAYTSANCLVTVAHTQIRCTSVAGVGIDMFVRVTVGGE